VFEPRKATHSIFGPAGLTGLWQPEDLYSNGAGKGIIRELQGVWELTEGMEYKTSGGKLKAPPPSLHAKWNKEVVEKLKLKRTQVINSFLFGGWALPFDGSKDHLFLANRKKSSKEDADAGVRAVDKAHIVQKVKGGALYVATDLTSAEALLSPSKPGPKITMPGRWSNKFMPHDAAVVAEFAAAARVRNLPAQAPDQKLQAFRLAASARADLCLAALPAGTFWEKVNWLEVRYGGKADPSMDIRNHFFSPEAHAAAAADVEGDDTETDDEEEMLEEMAANERGRAPVQWSDDEDVDLTPPRARHLYADDSEAEAE
jgi:hypothetical protein